MMIFAKIIAELINVVLIGLALLGMPALIAGWQGWRAGLGLRANSAIWRTGLALWRQDRLESDFASPMARLWPAITLASTVIAAALVPGFARNIWTGVPGLAIWVIGLLALARIARLLSVLDAGQGARGRAAGLAARSFWMVQTILLLGTMIAANALGGRMMGAGLPLGAAGLDTPGLDQIVLLLGLAAAIVGLAQDQAAPEGDLAGPDLALLRLEARLRPVVLVLLVFALFAPLWLADATRPASWGLGLLGFWVRLTLGFAAMAAAPRGVWRAGLIAMLLAGLALVVVLPR